MNKVLIIGAASALAIFTMVSALIAISDYLADYQDEVAEEASLSTERENQESEPLVSDVEKHASISFSFFSFFSWAQQSD